MRWTSLITALIDWLEPAIAGQEQVGLLFPNHRTAEDFRREFEFSIPFFNKKDSTPEVILCCFGGAIHLEVVGPEALRAKRYNRLVLVNTPLTPDLKERVFSSVPVGFIQEFDTSTLLKGDEEGILQQ